MHCTINRKYLRYFERNPRNIVNICANIYDNFNGKNRGLLPPGEDLVFYYKMKVDFHRYLAEFAEDRTEDVNESLVAYNKAFDIAKKGSSPHTSNQAGACSELKSFPLQLKRPNWPGKHLWTPSQSLTQCQRSGTRTAFSSCRRCEATFTSGHQSNREGGRRETH